MGRPYGTSFTVLFETDGSIIRMPLGLCELLELPNVEGRKLKWQDLVLEDSDTFSPPKTGTRLQRTAYLKKGTGELLEASFECERLADMADVICVDIALSSQIADESTKQGVDKESLDFLTTVSHELRVALNGVIGFANVLGGTRLDVEQLAVLEKLQACNNLLKGLINDILEYSRVATSKIDLNPEPVQLDSLVREVVGLFRERATKKGLELRFEAGKGTAIRTALPRMRVTQVISNLIGNAVKFTEHGWVAVTVSVADREICIGVQDTGPGIGESEVESIFRPFFQSSESSGANEGSGLGLSISKELVEKMGGRLTLRSPDEGGSLFEVSLPLNLANASETASPPKLASAQLERPSPNEASHSAQAEKRILVVEDNQLNADILGHFLQDYGVKFDHVDNGRSAVDSYEDGKYDLILMDVMLPEMNGYEATEKILARSRRKPSVPIVGVTAKVFRRDQVRCIEAGMVEVVHKPVDFKQLREVLDYHLFSKKRATHDDDEVPMFAQEDIERLNDPDVVADAPVSGEGDSSRSGLVASTLEAYIDRMKSSHSDRADIVKTAVGIVDNEIEQLLRSIRGGDRKEIGMRAHSLKGALALLGARNILDLAKGLELIATDGKSPLKGEHWGSLIRASYSEFKDQLESYMESTGAAIE